MSSNWLKLKEKLKKTQSEKEPIQQPNQKKKNIKKRKLEISETLQEAKRIEIESKPVVEEKLGRQERIRRSKYVALDCEMVGIGLTGKQSALARCSLV